MVDKVKIAVLTEDGSINVDITHRTGRGEIIMKYKIYYLPSKQTKPQGTENTSSTSPISTFFMFTK